MSCFRRWPLAAVIGVLLLSGISLPTRGADESPADPQQQVDAKISALIAKLGANEFATREKAQAELERMGLTAFDALHDAQFNDDIEIAMRARYLVRSMRVSWSREDDPVEVKRMLREYGAQSEAERRIRMGRLASLENGTGAPALARLVRFETSDLLSKRAALLMLQLKQPDDETQRRERAKMIRATVGLSKRQASAWIMAYADTLEDPVASLDAWQRLTRAELETYAQFPEKTDADTVRDLLRWHVELLRQLDRKDESLAIIRKMIDLMDGTREQMLEMVDWLMQRQVWSVIDDVANRYPDSFNEDPLLLYRLAESQIQRGNADDAEKTAERALRLTPDEPEAHVVAAFSLQERGLSQWAEREYRHVMKLGPTGSLYDLRARLLLAEMLHDAEQELPAAEVLQGAVDAMDKDPTVVQLLEQRLGREVGALKSRMHYFYAMDFATRGDQQQAKQRLEQGVQADPTDADVLIAMYRVPQADEPWKQMTLKRIEAATGQFRDQMDEFRRQSALAPSEPLRAWADGQLATACNQFAWLVGNTVGDYDEAIRASHSSVQIRPDAGGYFDTLGRCYYAKGDFANSVKYQRKAVELDPHSLQIRRQLKIFEDALAQSQVKDSPAADAPPPD